MRKRFEVTVGLVVRRIPRAKAFQSIADTRLAYP